MTEVFELAVERRIAAPPATVWAIMTERLTEWWCPRPWTTSIRSLDWHAGGDANLTMNGPDGEVHEQDGVILEYTPGERFVFTDALVRGWIPSGPFMVGTFEITADGDGTLYRATARHWTAQARDEHRAMGFEAGWTTVAQQLAAIAEGKTGTATDQAKAAAPLSV